MGMELGILRKMIEMKKKNVHILKFILLMSLWDYKKVQFLFYKKKKNSNIVQSIKPIESGVKIHEKQPNLPIKKKI